MELNSSLWILLATILAGIAQSVDKGFRFYLNENNEKMIKVGTIVNDLHNINITMQQMEPNDYFYFDPATWNIYAIDVVDREELCAKVDPCEYRLAIPGTITLNNSVTMVTELDAVVVVLDENDNKPTFEKSEYNVDLSKKEGVVRLPMADDKDVGRNAITQYVTKGLPESMSVKLCHQSSIDNYRPDMLTKKRLWQYCLTVASESQDSVGHFTFTLIPKNIVEMTTYEYSANDENGVDVHVTIFP